MYKEAIAMAAMPSCTMACSPPIILNHSSKNTFPEYCHNYLNFSTDPLAGSSDFGDRFLPEGFLSGFIITVVSAKGGVPRE